MVSSTVVRQRLDELKHTFELALLTAVTPSNSGPFLPPSYPAQLAIKCFQDLMVSEVQSTETAFLFYNSPPESNGCARAVVGTRDGRRHRSASEASRPRRRPRQRRGHQVREPLPRPCRVGRRPGGGDRIVPALHRRVSFPSGVAVLTDNDEWSAWRKIGDEVLHIELRKWADAMVIAPLSANTLAKIAGGLCDLLTCVVRAWDYNKPVYVAPAMNTFMWDNPFTRRHLDVVCELGMSLIPPVTKRLACGDYGNGAMQEPSEICRTVRLFFGPQDRQLL